MSDKDNSIDLDENNFQSDNEETENDYVYQISDSQEFPKKITKNQKKKLTRKRQINKADWKSEKAKKAKLSGTAGISKDGKPITPVKMGIGCGSCRFSCQKKITFQQRKLIFDEFWTKNLKNLRLKS